MAPGEEAEVVIVGGGPAGSMAAAVLAERGREVLVIDKSTFPREKPCGDGVLRPAVAAAERLGLTGLIESSLAIEGGRVVMGYRRQTGTRFDRADGPLPRCITRNDFDLALIEAAKERGARLLRARVDAVDFEGGRQRVAAVAGEERLQVRGGVVIAADGATSRIRRQAKGAANRPLSYAIRQYFRTERALDPIYHFDIPLEVEGRVVPGYGWVFPLGEHVANIGVGTIRQPYVESPSLRRLLAIYVSELETKAARRFGALEPIGEPLGSPVGIRSQLEVADSPGLAFVGDAAGTTHPMTGEGIAFAMRGGEAVAEAIDARLRRGGGRAAAAEAGARIRRSFPQLGVDTGSLTRISLLELNASPLISTGSDTTSGPLLAAVKRFGRESAYETGVAGSPAWEALDAVSPALAESLESANELLLDRLADRMPFVTEVIHATSRRHLGPMYAAAVLASAGGGGEASETALEAGVAAESVGVMPRLVTMLVDRASSKWLQANNALGVLTVDFAATKALTAANTVGPAAAAAILGKAFRSGCQGSMRDAAARFAADRTTASWYEAARETAGAAMVLATQLGTLARGEDLAAAEELREYSLELGIAVRLAEEIADLTVDEGLLPEGSGSLLRRGIYPLPVLYALEAEPSLARLLAQHTAGGCQAEEIVAAVRESGGLERARLTCIEHVETARALALAHAGAEAAVTKLAGAPAEYVSSRVPFDALEAC